MEPSALLVHVSDVKNAMKWYMLAFPQAEFIDQEIKNIAILKLEQFQIEIVLEDSKVKSGSAGTVLYWQVDSIATEIQRLEGIGAKIHRGPIEIENNQLMCQLQDPYGNLIGLRGK